MGFWLLYFMSWKHFTPVQLVSCIYGYNSDGFYNFIQFLQVADWDK